MNLIGYFFTFIPSASVLVLFLLVFISAIVIYRPLCLASRNRRKGKENISTCVILGPGGHCREMLTLIEKVDFISKYSPVTFIIGVEDTISVNKLRNSNLLGDKSRVHFIRRSRHVGQSYLSSIVTTLVSFYDSIKIMLQVKCDLLICNGPGTCIPPMIVAFLLYRPKIIFVESFCRVESLSLSGKIASYFADHVLVQWEELKKKYPRCKYIGLMV